MSGSPSHKNADAQRQERAGEHAGLCTRGTDVMSAPVDWERLERAVRDAVSPGGDRAAAWVRCAPMPGGALNIRTEVHGFRVLVIQPDNLSPWYTAKSPLHGLVQGRTAADAIVALCLPWDTTSYLIAGLPEEYR